VTDAIGFSLLICAAGMGLLYLAVYATAVEHAVAAAVVGAVALPVAVVRPEAGIMLMLLAVGTRRFCVPPVPDRVPVEWTDR
jgi:hypothetical protein